MPKPKSECDHRGYLVPIRFEVQDEVEPRKFITAQDMNGPKFRTFMNVRLIQCFSCEKYFHMKANVQKVNPVSPVPLPLPSVKN